MRFGLLTAFTLSLLLPIDVSAQSLGGLGNISGEAFTLSVSPQYPAPYSQATVSILSGSVDVTNSTVTALVGGKEVYKGSARPFSVQLGKTGSVTNVKVTVVSGGASFSQTISIQPQDVVLVAEPISSAPPLYQGKPIVPIGGDVRIVAMANLRDSGGKSASPTTYSYAWTVDATRIANSSGIGKSAIIVASPLQYRSRTVSVVVTNANGSQVGGASLSLSAEQPSLRVYENDPLLGIRYDRALSGSYSITGSESTLYAAPFSLPTTGGAPFIQWFLNGSSVQTGNLITLRPTGSGQGSASLSLTASSGDLTPITTVLSLIFGDKPSSNFFGL
ncbi:MAG: hypothetical protein Q8P17_00050 [bacterium]|nr:hypothetical protein [bacterium]